MKQHLSKKTIGTICSVMMIVTLFVGSLITYGESFGKYTDTYGISGYHILFNGPTIYSLVLLAVPVLLLLMRHFDKLKEKESLWRFVLPIASLLVLIVIRLNVKDTVGLGNAAAASYAVSFKSSFGLSGWLYLISNVVLLFGGIIDYFHLNVTEESVKQAIQEKDLSGLCEKKKEEEDK